MDKLEKLFLEREKELVTAMADLLLKEEDPLFILDVWKAVGSLPNQDFAILVHRAPGVSEKLTAAMTSPEEEDYQRKLEPFRSIARQMANIDFLRAAPNSRGKK